jgi:hypothetical protein
MRLKKKQIHNAKRVFCGKPDATVIPTTHRRPRMTGTSGSLLSQGRQPRI